MEKQHKKRYIKMIRMLSSKDERTCEDKVRCIENRALIQMLITKVTYNTRGINGSKYRRTRRCIRNRRNGKIQVRRHNEDEMLLRSNHQKIANIYVTKIWNPAVVWKKHNSYWTKRTRSAEWKTKAMFPNLTSQDAYTITSQMCAKWLVTLTRTVAFFDQRWASI